MDTLLAETSVRQNATFAVVSPEIRVTPSARHLDNLVVPALEARGGIEGDVLFEDFAGLGGELRATLLLVAGRVPFTIPRILRLMSEVRGDSEMEEDPLLSLTRQVIQQTGYSISFARQTVYAATLQRGDMLTKKRSPVYTLESTERTLNGDILASVVAFAELSTSMQDEFGFSAAEILGEKTRLDRSPSIELLRVLSGIYKSEKSPIFISDPRMALGKNIPDHIERIRQLPFGTNEPLIGEIVEFAKGYIPSEGIQNHARTIIENIEELQNGEAVIVLNIGSGGYYKVTELIGELVDQGRTQVSREELFELYEERHGETLGASVLTTAIAKINRASEIIGREFVSPITDNEENPSMFTGFFLNGRVIPVSWGEEADGSNFVARAEETVFDGNGNMSFYHAVIVETCGLFFGKDREGITYFEFVAILERINKRTNHFGGDEVEVLTYIHGFAKRYLSNHFTSVTEKKRGATCIFLSETQKQRIDRLLHIWDEGIERYNSMVGTEEGKLELAELFRGVNEVGNAEEIHPEVRPLVYHLISSLENRRSK
ncbi:MAG TPA: hypothetical protein ENI23_02760 [bacterium]|nr:hypothetical protein [bacterium]